MESAHRKTEMAYMFYGGHKNLERIRVLQQIFRKNPILVNQFEANGVDHLKRVEIEGKFTRELIKLHKSGKLQESDYQYSTTLFSGHGKALQHHFTVFLPLFLSFSPGDKETNQQKIQQRQHYLNQINKLEILGSCLLGEINMNTGIQIDNPFENTQTIANYDLSTHQFVLNTPSGIYKRSQYFTLLSTHVLIFARLMIGPQMFGIHPFLVEIRNLKTGKLHSDVELKYFGPSTLQEADGVSIGVAFRNTTIGGQSMLTRFFDFAVQGEVKDVKDASMKEAPLVYERVMMRCHANTLLQASFDLVKGLQITLTYSHMRKQFPTLEGSKTAERKIIDYQNHKARLYPLLATGLIRHLGLISLSNNVTYVTKVKERKPHVNHQIAVMLSALTIHITRSNFDALEVIRETMGGSGFLHTSGIPGLQFKTLTSTVSNSTNAEEVYLEFASIILSESVQKITGRGEFMQTYFKTLSEDENFVRAKINKREDLTDTYATLGLLALKGIWYHTKLRTLLNDKTTLKDLQSLVRTNPVSLTLINEFIGTILDYMLAIFALAAQPLRYVNSQFQLFYYHLRLYCETRILNDPTALASHGYDLPAIVNIIAEDQEELIKIVETTAFDALEAFDFSSNELFSIVSLNSEKYYQAFYDVMKLHNPRNNPKDFDDVQKDLLKEVQAFHAKL